MRNHYTEFATVSLHVKGIIQFYDLFEGNQIKQNEIEEFIKCKVEATKEPGKGGVKKVKLEANTINLRHLAVLYYLWVLYSDENSDGIRIKSTLRFSESEALSLAFCPSDALVRKDVTLFHKTPKRNIYSYLSAFMTESDRFPQGITYITSKTMDGEMEKDKAPE